MKLDAYLKAGKGRLTSLARQIGVPITTLHGWATQRRRPNVDMAVAIERATGGAVTVAELAVEVPGVRSDEPLSCEAA